MGVPLGAGSHGGLGVTAAPGDTTAVLARVSSSPLPESTRSWRLSVKVQAPAGRAAWWGSHRRPLTNLNTFLPP